MKTILTEWYLVQRHWKTPLRGKPIKRIFLLRYEKEISKIYNSSICSIKYIGINSKYYQTYSPRFFSQEPTKLDTWISSISMDCKWKNNNSLFYWNLFEVSLIPMLETIVQNGYMNIPWTTCCLFLSPIVRPLYCCHFVLGTMNPTP